MATEKHDAAMKEIATGKPELKHAETTDKSGPVIEKDTKIKKVDRSGFLGEVAKGTDLKHAETADKSGPVIEKDVKIGKNEHKALLGEVVKKAGEK